MECLFSSLFQASLRDEVDKFFVQVPDVVVPELFVISLTLVAEDIQVVEPEDLIPVQLTEQVFLVDGQDMDGGLGNRYFLSMVRTWTVVWAR